MLIESEIREKRAAEWQQKNQTKVWNMPGALTDVIITWAETKILKGKTK